MDLPLKRYWELLRKYLKPLRFKVLLLALLIFTTIGLQLVNPQITRYFIDTAINHQGKENVNQTLFFTALAFLGAALLLQGVSVAATYVGEDVGWRATNQMRADLAQHCLHLDMAFHNDHTPGEMIERIGLVNFLEGIGVDIDPNMVATPRTNPYVRTDGWEDEVARIQAKKAAA